ncbi:hypothetical protein [Pleionea sediminis]|uniref:hypothetical protein n=1 Tax=Pleionea sediminis TaxID=2569479 RepID=UPI0011860AFC|nr:hypothetical protein [Pleionea sediminis]
MLKQIIYDKSGFRIQTHFFGWVNNKDWTEHLEHSVCDEIYRQNPQTGEFELIDFNGFNIH